MRIAYVCADPGVPVLGRKGCSIHVQEIIRAFQAHGARVDLFAMSRGGIPAADLGKAVLYQIGVSPTGTAGEREAEAYKANSCLKTMLQREGPFNLVYERYSLWSYAGMEYARDTRTPGVLEVNAPLIEEQATHRVLVNRALAEDVAARVFSAARAIIAVSREVASYLDRYEAARGRVRVVPNGVNAGRFREDTRPSLPARPGVFTVGFVGTLKPWHGLPVLVKAFALFHKRHPGTRLLIVGDGTGRDHLLEELSAHGLIKCTHRTGAVPPEDVPGLLASMDVAVCPYQQQDFYFSPLKVYEYMAAGLPVVTSGIGQLEELVENHATGLVVPPDDITALAEALSRLLVDPELRKKLGQAGRAAVLRDHTWNGIAGKILDIAGIDPVKIKAGAEVTYGKA
ncbi:MAG: glycosyltransferase family 4 protein [Dehalococcoidia bacterium]|nr:glycosyltransferase family 4 protein [Dehalococcoidia bacterium]